MPGSRKILLQAKAAMIATKLGVPLPKILTVLRQALGIQCEFCAAFVGILRQLNQYDAATGEKILGEILEAKRSGNINRLHALALNFARGEWPKCCGKKGTS